MAWKPEVKVQGEDSWHSNALVFETEAEALEWAQGLFCRWTLTTAFRATEVDGIPANYKMVDGEALELDVS